MNQTSKKVLIMTSTALLSAIGILIPMYFPKIVVPPASFTLASHVPIFIAMFISPVVAIFVALITSFGFLFAGLPLIIVFRALTHLIFAYVGAYFLQKKGNLLCSLKTAIPFVLLISILHAVCEVIVSSIFFFHGEASTSYLVTVIGLVGAGTLLHSIADFIIASVVWVPLQNVVSLPTSARIKLKASSR